MNPASVFQGPALLVVRTNRHPGDITVKATAEGLEPAEVFLNSN